MELLVTVAKKSQSLPRVILSGGRTSRSEVLAESKDPYSLLPLHACVQTSSPCMGLQR